MRPTGAVLRRFMRGGGGLARKAPALHPKYGNRSWYKGSGARPLGRHTRKGAYWLDYARRVPQYVVPGAGALVAAATPGVVPPELPPALRVGAPGWDHGLKPYVSASTPKVVVPPPPGAIGAPGDKKRRAAERKRNAR